jgi:hypothetical protein
MARNAPKTVYNRLQMAFGFFLASALMGGFSGLAPVLLSVAGGGM